MGKNVYLIISDLHDFHKNIDNRFDYPGEIMKVKEYILELAQKYTEQGYNTYAILLGDVNNRSYSSVNSGILNNNYWIAANKLFKKIYCVLGNHETTFYNSNPFFTLVSEITSVKLQMLQHKVWQPIGLFNVFNVVDYFDDGEVAFHFNHHNCPITLPDTNRFNVGLFHTDFVFSEIAKASEDVYGMNAFITNTVKADGNEFLDRYDICFFAHHHKIYGCWNVETDKGHNCTVYHLASLGRPNVSEVSDNFLERNIPALIVEDGKFKTIEDNKFNLPSRAECVREELVQLNKENYKRVKDLRLAKDYSPIKDNPIENVRDFIANDVYLTNIFEELLTNDKDNLSYEIEKELEKGGIDLWRT